VRSYGSGALGRARRDWPCDTTRGLGGTCSTAIEHGLLFCRIQRGKLGLEKVPPEYRAELEGLEDLGDEELWRIARSRLEPARQRRLEELLDKNQRGELTDRERRSLGDLRSEADRLMLRRSYAALLLKYRGHRVPSPEGA
jgi:hypothetical protein